MAEVKQELDEGGEFDIRAVLQRRRELLDIESPAGDTDREPRLDRIGKDGVNLDYVAGTNGWNEEILAADIASNEGLSTTELRELGVTTAFPDALSDEELRELRVDEGIRDDGIEISEPKLHQVG